MPPAWIPRNLLADPSRFGRPGESAQWLHDEFSEGVLAAGYFHHRVAQVVVAQIKSEGPSVLQAMSAETGEGIDYVRSKVYGHRPISLEDLMKWVSALGVQILPSVAVANFGDLLPPR